mgnify:CR=1 FL=1
MPRSSSPLAVKAAAEYAYVSRDVRRIQRALVNSGRAVWLGEEAPVQAAAILLPIILYSGAIGLQGMLDLPSLTGISSPNALLWMTIWVVGIIGAITGRAIYEGTLDFTEGQKLADELTGN